jgi:hypothetical protein
MCLDQFCKVYHPAKRQVGSMFNCPAVIVGIGSSDANTCHFYTRINLLRGIDRIFNLLREVIYKFARIFFRQIPFSYPDSMTSGCGHLGLSFIKMSTPAQQPDSRIGLPRFIFLLQPLNIFSDYSFLYNWA